MIKPSDALPIFSGISNLFGQNLDQNFKTNLKINVYGSYLHEYFTNRNNIKLNLLFRIKNPGFK